MRQEQRLSLEQRQMVKCQQVMLQIELTAILRDEKYEAQGNCPKCGREMKAHEILAGFLDVVDDFTTRCTGCNHRFEPKLICFGAGSQIEVPFYCGPQAQNRLAECCHMAPSEIARQHPGEYRSAVVHYGTLTAMFGEMGISYQHNEIEGWQGKVLPFLGRMPDTVIAKCVQVTPKAIARLRRAQKIGAYTKRVALQEAQEQSS